MLIHLSCSVLARGHSMQHDLEFLQLLFDCGNTDLSLLICLSKF